VITLSTDERFARVVGEALDSHATAIARKATQWASDFAVHPRTLRMWIEQVDTLMLGARQCYLVQPTGGRYVYPGNSTKNSPPALAARNNLEQAAHHYEERYATERERTAPSSPYATDEAQSS
jgi:hypothetical protein